jgi:hypothetical protein
MKKIFYLFVIFLINSNLLFSQVAINADGSPPDASAGLDVSYPDKGFLLPRLTFDQRNAIQNPAEGLIVYCTNCDTEGKGVLCIFEGASWKTLDLRCDKPNMPAQDNQVPSINQIIWDWDEVPIACGYRWSTVNDYTTATDLGLISSYTEPNLACNTSYTRYVWAYNQCGYSLPLVLQQTTEQIPLSGAPAEGIHSSTLTTIEWNWNVVAEATGYKWNDVNDYSSAIDMGTLTTISETDLECGTQYTRYVWGYNECGASAPTVLIYSTANQASETPVSAEHITSAYEIIWKWHTVGEADGYKWNTTDDYASATELGSDTSFTEADLDCLFLYTRYVWSYNNCGFSVACILTGSTTGDTQPAPTAADHISSATQVEWNWHPLPDGHPSNYKWNTIDNYNSATDLDTDTSFVETGLNCNTPYTRYVWAYDNCAVSLPVTLTATTSLSPPETPGAAVHEPLATQITWNWNEVIDATGYLWSTDNNPETAQDMFLITSYTENGLVCNTNYIRYVWAYSDCGTSDATTLTQITSLDPPPAPAPASHEAYPTLIIWNWSPVEGAQGYKWSTTNNYGSAMEMGASTSKIETGLTCNTNYTRYIWAYGDCGVSNAAAIVQTTALDPPQSPGAGTHEPSPAQIIWHWFAVSGATGYKWNTTNDYSTAQDMGTATLKTETGLSCNTNYTRFVWSYSACGNSAAVNLDQTTSLDPPVPPTAAVHAPSPNQVIWNWNPVSGATGYKWNTTNNISTAIDVGLLTTHTETGLSCNTPYIRYIWSYSNCGTSTPASLTQTTSLDPPAAPIAASHTATASQIVWRWNAVSGATGYKWNTTNNYATATDMGVNISRTENGLNCNTAYTRFVWAYSNCGTSTSASLTQTTTIETPPAPASGTHVASNTQVIWNWTAVAGATGYKWNTINDYATAVNMNTSTSYTENNLVCGTTYTRFVWAYNNCANSVSVSLVKTTSSNPPGTPVAASHVPSGNQIVWNWNAAAGATSYKWNTTDDYATAIDISNVISRTETGLDCSTGYTRYLWAFNGCSGSASVSLSSTTTEDPPAAPASGSHNATASQITWNWTTVPDATGYKWNIVNSYASATDMGSATSQTENGLACSTMYTRFVWAYNGCGVSTSVPLTQETSNDPPASPTEAAHVASPEQIIWNWNTVSGAAGYKWNTTDNYGTAIDMGSSTSRTETGLGCGTSFTRYVWAYHSCGNSTSTTLTQSTGACFVCGTTITKTHVAGTVAPVDKTTTYATLTNVPGAETKCWITSNLGSDHQATAVNDNTEASAGWYWQFNRMQGYKHDGTTRTPAGAWTNSIDEYSQWVAANDPCTIELGSLWRVPTSTEWSQVDASGYWTNWNGPWNSVLKMHAAGRIDYFTGNLDSRGSKGLYWSSTQSAYTYMGMYLNFFSSGCSMSYVQKSYGYSVRCIKD